MPILSMLAQRRFALAVSMRQRWINSVSMHLGEVGGVAWRQERDFRHSLGADYGFAASLGLMSIGDTLDHAWWMEKIFRAGLYAMGGRSHSAATLMSTLVMRTLPDNK